MGYPRGLISFTTEDAIQNGHTNVFRPRLLGYAAVLIAMLGIFAYAITDRVALGVEVLRDRGVRMYRVAGSDIQNIYTVKINNMDRESHIYDIQVRGDFPFEVNGYRPMTIAEGEMLTIPVRVAVPRSLLTEVQTEIVITVQARENPELKTEHTTSFIGPQQRPN